MEDNPHERDDLYAIVPDPPIDPDIGRVSNTLLPFYESNDSAPLSSREKRRDRRLLFWGLAAWIIFLAAIILLSKLLG